MLHPYAKDRDEVKVNLDFCTTYNGIPYGPALIDYKDPISQSRSFKGVGVFNDGKLHNSTFNYKDGDGLK